MVQLTALCWRGARTDLVSAAWTRAWRASAPPHGLRYPPTSGASCELRPAGRTRSHSLVRVFVLVVFVVFIVVVVLILLLYSFSERFIPDPDSMPFKLFT